MIYFVKNEEIFSILIISVQRRKLLPFLLFLISVLAPVIAYAAGSVFDSSACNTLNIVTGTPGKIFAAFAVVATGVGFFTGKISWGLLIGVVGGIAVIFGAPSIVAAISGEPMFECQQGVQYVSDCSGSSCYSCPMGFSGENCDVCATGYQGANCDSCADGYTGYNCSECDSLGGYYSSGNYCFKACAVSFKGISAGTVVLPTDEIEEISCDEPGFDGTVPYTCISEVFEASPGEVCGCEGNRGCVDCDECQTGYDISTNCTTLLSGYYDTENGPQPECDVSAEVVTGVPFGSGTDDISSVLPIEGNLGCSVMGYKNNISYKCEDSVFEYNGSCECDDGYVGAISDCAASCDTANNYNRDPVSGECKKGCDVSEPGLATTWVDMTLLEEVLNCDSENFEGDLVYSCDPDNSGFVIIEDNCSCETGYSGTDCLSCDAAGGYSDDGSGNCIAGCTIDIAGSNAVWVSPTSTTLQISCDVENYDGEINYTCANNTFDTVDSCICEVGFDINNQCTTCDSANGFSDDGSGGCAAGCDITGIDPLVTQTWAAEGSSSVTCLSAPDGYNRSLTIDCSANNYSITSVNTSCVCPTGYTGPTCTSCDSANGYSMQSGVCKNGCYINMLGITADYWVNKTSSLEQLSCNSGNYEGTINYSCDGNNFSTSDSCSCKVGYTLSSGCTACDSANNYNFVSGYCQKSCSVPTNITDMQIPSSGYVGQGSGSLTCNSSTTAGINNRSAINYSCDANGNFSATQTSCACDVGYSGSDCTAIDTDNGYIDDGSGNPILTCDISVTGISDTYVTLGSDSLTCNVGNYEGSVPYNCDSSRNPNISGSCSCATGYAGSDCSTCDTGYNIDGGSCKSKCTISGQDGILANTVVDSGSNNIVCNEGEYRGDFTYDCNDGVLSSVNNGCNLPTMCFGGQEINSDSGKMHVFLASSNLRCDGVINNAKVLVVGGGGGGSRQNNAGGGGGGAGGISYDNNFTLTNTTYSVVVGDGGAGSTSNSRALNGENSSFGSLLAYGGGGGGAGKANGYSGGSGGGVGRDGTSSNQGGAATKGVGPNTYGNRGGNGTDPMGWSGAGGGGGAGGVGGNGIGGTQQDQVAGNGGPGMNFSAEFGTTYGESGWFAGGGGGSYNSSGAKVGGIGGQGGGGNMAQSGVDNTGGGGGGNMNGTPGSGGSGIVIIKYSY